MVHMVIHNRDNREGGLTLCLELMGRQITKAIKQQRGLLIIKNTYNVRVLYVICFECGDVRSHYKVTTIDQFRVCDNYRKQE